MIGTLSLEGATCSLALHDLPARRLSGDLSIHFDLFFSLFLFHGTSVSGRNHNSYHTFIVNAQPTEVLAVRPDTHVLVTLLHVPDASLVMWKQ